MNIAGLNQIKEKYHKVASEIADSLPADCYIHFQNLQPKEGFFFTLRTVKGKIVIAEEPSVKGFLISKYNTGFLAIPNKKATKKATKNTQSIEYQNDSDL